MRFYLFGETSYDFCKGPHFSIIFIPDGCLETQHLNQHIIQVMDVAYNRRFMLQD